MVQLEIMQKYPHTTTQCTLQGYVHMSMKACVGTRVHVCMNSSEVSGSCQN